MDMEASTFGHLGGLPPSAHAENIKSSLEVDYNIFQMYYYYLLKLLSMISSFGWYILLPWSFVNGLFQLL